MATVLCTVCEREIPLDELAKHQRAEHPMRTIFGNDGQGGFSSTTPQVNFAPIEPGPVVVLRPSDYMDVTNEIEAARLVAIASVEEAFAKLRSRFVHFEPEDLSPAEPPAPDA